MQKPRTHLLWLIGCAMVMLLASGCFQPAGGNPSSLSVAQIEGATFTPDPTDIPLPTLTPDVIVVTSVVLATPDPNLLFIPTTDPNLFVPTQDLSLVAVQPTIAPPVALGPLDMTATYIVQQATDIAGIPLTATYCAQGFCVPTATPAPLVAATAVPLPGTDCVHEVSAGENLYRISLRYGLQVDDIARASGVVNSNVISIGQKLTIPGCGTTGAAPPPTTVPTQIAGGGIFTPTPLPVGGPVTAGTTYRVQQGDTLYAISVRTGVLINSILAANPTITDMDQIFINQEIVIPAQ